MEQRSKLGNAHSRTTHGMSHTVEYESWKHMRQRCSNPNDKRFEHYGARRIKVCARCWNKYTGDSL